MQQQHALLRQIETFKATDFGKIIDNDNDGKDTVENVRRLQAREAFYTLCDVASAAINNPTLAGGLNPAREAFLQCLPQSLRKNPNIHRGLAAIQDSVAKVTRA